MKLKLMLLALLSAAVMSGCCNKHEPVRPEKLNSPQSSQSFDIFEPPYHSTYVYTATVNGHEYVIADKPHEAVSIVHSESCTNHVAITSLLGTRHFFTN